MSVRSDDAPTIRALALCIDDLVIHPEQRAALGAMVDHYLEGRADGTIEAFPFPGDPEDTHDLDPDPGAPLTPEQQAAALVALHEIYCPGVERPVDIAVDLPPFSDPSTLANDKSRRAWRRTAAWTATLARVRSLGESPHLLQWCKLQFRRLEQSLRRGTPQPDAKPAPASVRRPKRDRPTKKRGTVHQRMLEHICADPQSTAWTQRQWADFLDCSPAAVAQAGAWHTVKAARAMAQAERLDRVRGAGRK